MSNTFLAEYYVIIVSMAANTPMGLDPELLINCGGGILPHSGNTTSLIVYTTHQPDMLSSTNVYTSEILPGGSPHYQERLLKFILCGILALISFSYFIQARIVHSRDD